MHTDLSVEKATLKQLLRLWGHQHWLPFGVRDRVLRAFYPDARPAETFDVEYFGLRYIGDLSVYIDWSVFFYGVYEGPALSCMQDLMLGRRGTVLDVGANVGQHALYMSRCAEQVHAFEPWPAVAARILQNIKANNLRNIYVHQVALGANFELKDYYAPRPGSTNLGTGSFSATHLAESNTFFGALQVVEGDDYLDQHGITSVQLLKIDTEGWEKYVLLGLKRTLIRNRPAVFMEFSETTQTTFADEKELRQCLPDDYTLFGFKASRFRNDYSLHRFQYYDSKDIVAVPNESVSGLRRLKIES